MIKLARAIVVGVVFFTAGTGANKALAEEDWVPHLAGIGEGQEVGVVPPAGLYLFNEVDWTSTSIFYDFNKNYRYTTHIAVDVPALLWAPGVQFFGADYDAGIVQPFDYASTSGPGHPRTNLGTRGGIYDTVLIPGQLSWKLPDNVFFKTSLYVYLPDGNFEKPSVMAFPNSIGFFALEPNLNLTYAPGPWNFSAGVYYDHNFENETTHYTSADILGGDYTVMRWFGRWGLGVGGSSQTQFNNDTLDGVMVPNSKTSNYGAGPIVSYNFGAAVLQFTYNYRFSDPYIVQTSEFWTDLSLRF